MQKGKHLQCCTCRLSFFLSVCLSSSSCCLSLCLLSCSIVTLAASIVMQLRFRYQVYVEKGNFFFDWQGSCKLNSKPCLKYKQFSILHNISQFVIVSFGCKNIALFHFAFYCFADYLVTKCGVLMMSLFVFFTTTMSVSFTLRETQTRMLKFTGQFCLIF